MSKLLYAKFFQAEEVRKDKTVARKARAEEILRWMDSPIHKEFYDWVVKNADSAVVSVDHTSLLVETARSNTFKMVRDKLRRMRGDSMKELSDE